MKHYDEAYEERKRKILSTEEGRDSQDGQRIIEAMEKRELRKLRNRLREEALGGRGR